MRTFIFTLALLMGSLSGFAGSDLTIHDFHFYDILAPHSKLECRYVADESYGFWLERGAGDKVRVALITAGKLEGRESAFEIGIKEKAAIGLHLYLYERRGAYGKYVEFELLNRRSSFLKYRLPGTFMQVSAMYVKGENGKEVENLYPDTSKRMACEIR